MEKCKITKLKKLEARKDVTNPWGMNDNEIVEGYYNDLPEVGKRFLVSSQNDGVLTSTVKALYIHDSGADKLILDESFPDATLLDFSNLGLKTGDILLATNNSVYLVKFEGRG